MVVLDHEARICKKCGFKWWMNEEDEYWNEQGYGYSVKLCDCPECGTPKIIKYYEDCSLDLNTDTRWYSYKK